MRQILQNLKTGKTELVDVPVPNTKSGSLIIQTQKSLISPGTERMLVEFSKGNLLAKAKAQPDKVKQVLDKIRTDGLMPTLETVFKRLDEPLPLGYCNSGVVAGGNKKIRRSEDQSISERQFSTSQLFNFSSYIFKAGERAVAGEEYQVVPSGAAAEESAV